MTNMVQRFPFVIFDEGLLIADTFCTRPYACLAMLGASCHADVHLQRRLCRMFNSAVAERLVQGKFALVDLLQGLLIHLAW